MAEERVPAGEKVLGGVRVLLSQTKDQLKLFAALEVPQDFVPGAFTREQFVELFANVPRECLHGEILRDLFDHIQPGAKLEPRRIAKGREPVHGRDGRILLMVKPFRGSFRPGELERVDPKYVRAFDNIEKGAIVARIYAETLGHPGLSVLGAPLSATPGKPAKIEIDAESLELRKDSGFQNVVAKQVGYLSDAGGKLVVQNLLKIQGDVNYKTGDIDFIGAVLVTGDVGKDFEITARGDITIQGNLAGGRLRSTTGNVLVKGGVNGELLGSITVSSRATSHAIQEGKFTGRAEIRSKGSITASQFEGVYLESGLDIVAQREIRGCSVHARGAVRVPKGALVAGVVKAICGIEAKSIGTHAGSVTRIQLLSDVESSAEYSEIVEKIERHIQAEQALELHLGPYALHPSRIQLLVGAQRQKMQKLSTELKKLHTSRDALEKEKAILLAGAKFNRLLRVNIGEVLYPGVSISVGKQEFSVTEPLRGPKTIEFLPDENRFVVTDLQPLQCELPK